MIPWTTIAITVAAQAVIGGLILALVKIYGRAKVNEVRRDIAEDEAERRARDAEILSRAHVDRPLSRMRPR